MKNRGFSLIELVVVFAIISVVSVSGFSVYKVWQSRNTLINGRMVLVSALYEAKNMATLGNSDSNWGIKNLPGKIILFSGDSYNERNISKDKIFDLPPGVTVSILDEYIFTKFTGLPQTELNTNVFYGGESLQVNVNLQGILSY